MEYGYAESENEVAVEDWMDIVYDEMLSPSTICFENIDALKHHFTRPKIHSSRWTILAVFFQGNIDISLNDVTSRKKKKKKKTKGKNNGCKRIITSIYLILIR